MIQFEHIFVIVGQRCAERHKVGEGVGCDVYFCRAVEHFQGIHIEMEMRGVRFAHFSGFGWFRRVEAYGFDVVDGSGVHAAKAADVVLEYPGVGIGVERRLWRSAFHFYKNIAAVPRPVHACAAVNRIEYSFAFCYGCRVFKAVHTDDKTHVGIVPGWYIVDFQFVGTGNVVFDQKVARVLGHDVFGAIVFREDKIADVIIKLGETDGVAVCRDVVFRKVQRLAASEVLKFNFNAARAGKVFLIIVFVARDNCKRCKKNGSEKEKNVLLHGMKRKMIEC